MCNILQPTLTAARSAKQAQVNVQKTVVRDYHCKGILLFLEISRTLGPDVQCSPPYPTSQRCLSADQLAHPLDLGEWFRNWTNHLTPQKKKLRAVWWGKDNDRTLPKVWPQTPGRRLILQGWRWPCSEIKGEDRECLAWERTVAANSPPETKTKCSAALPHPTLTRWQLQLQGSVTRWTTISAFDFNCLACFSSATPTLLSSPLGSKDDL